MEQPYASWLLYDFRIASSGARSNLATLWRGKDIYDGALMQSFELTQLISQQKSNDKLYLEFLRMPDLSMGLYILPAGGTDPQSPHTEDEVYYVVSGKAMIRVGEEDRNVGTGSIVYVEKNAEHSFHSIEEELKLLVFFAPAEYSKQKD
jgi:mannose-6-phosphate isomerase-like protein (cupin superfamily)